MKKLILYLLLILPVLLVQAQSVNVTELKPAASSSDRNGNLVASKGVDGTLDGSGNNRWVAAPGDVIAPATEWIAVDLQAPFNIDSYKLYLEDHPAGHPESWALQYWDDALNAGSGGWATADSITIATRPTPTGTLSGQFNSILEYTINLSMSPETDSVRFIVTECPTLVRLYELQVFGTAVPGPTPATDLNITFDDTIIEDRGDVSLTWTDNSEDENGYRVQRRDRIFGDAPWETIAELGVDATSYTDTTVNVLTGASYLYRITNYFSSGALSNSDADTLLVTNPNNVFLNATAFATNNGSGASDSIVNAFDGDRTTDRWMNSSGSLPDTVEVRTSTLAENVYGIGILTGSSGLGYNNGLIEFSFELYNETTGSFDTLFVETSGPSNGIYYRVFDEPVTIDSVRMIVNSAHGSNRTRVYEIEAYANPVTWDGSVWSNGTGPTQYDAVFINGDYNTTTNGDLVAQYIQINEGVTVTVEADTRFYGIGDPLATVDASEQFLGGIIQNNGELIRFVGGTIEADTEIRGNPIVVPGIPENLVVVPDSINQQVTITWDDVAIDEVGYLIEKMWTDSLGVDGLDTLGWVVLKDTVTNSFNIDQEQNGVITPRTISFVDDGTLDTLGINTSFYLGRRYQYRVRAHSTIDSARVTDVVDAIFAENSPENLALNKPVTASSVNGSNVPEGAVDWRSIF